MSDTNEYLTHIGGSMNPEDIAGLIVDKIMENENNKLVNT